jgi:hypothetical protein
VYRFDNWRYSSASAFLFFSSHWIRDLISPFYHDRSRQKGETWRLSRQDIHHWLKLKGMKEENSEWNDPTVKNDWNGWTAPKTTTISSIIALFPRHLLLEY